MARQKSSAPTRPGHMAFKKRPRCIPKDTIMGITRPSIRRLARRGGVIRMKKDIYDEVRGLIKERLSNVLRHVVLVLESSQTHKHDRKLVTTRDIVFALNRMGHTLVGFSGV